MVKKDLSTQQRNKIVQFLIEGSNGGKPCRGRMRAATLKFSTSRQTVYRLWTAAKKQRADGNAIHIRSGKLTYTKKKTVHLDLTLLMKLDLSKRSTIESLAMGLGQSKSTVGRWVQAGLVRTHTSAIKPDLTAPNKLLRLRFTLKALQLDRILNVIKFRNMHNTVHIDEKWFYITRGSRRFYLAPEEAEPHRTCKSKQFITKIMFMCAVCRPLIADNGEVLFDGKIGIWPFAEEVPAKRNSKNRQAGTLEVKAIDSITKHVIKDCVINKILPAIMSKWPEGASKEINIQQDNARPHISNSDQDFRAATSHSGFNINLVQQPPNSPDCNVNDLGWFRSIQSLQVKTAAKTVVELINAVKTSFHDLQADKLNDVFLSLQGCMIEIMKVRGRNNYTQPHMSKGALKRSNQLPLNLEVPTDLVIQCLDYVKELGCFEERLEIMQTIGLDMND